MTLKQTQSAPLERLPSMTLDRAQLVQLLGTSDSAFDRARKNLESHNFPLKLPGMHKWSLPAVVAWIKANGNKELMHQILIGEPILDAIEGVEVEVPGIPDNLKNRYGGNAA
jgi:hypothetical protein